MRENWRPNRTAIYWPPLLWPSASLSRSLRLLNRRPWGPLHWVWLPLSHLVSNSSDLQLTDFLSPPSYIIVQSPTQYLPITGHRDVSLPLSLEWHVWFSSSGNNCHAFHRSLSSGASVYMTVPRDFTFSHIVSQVRLHQSNMQLPRLWNGMFGRVEGQYTTYWTSPEGSVPQSCSCTETYHQSRKPSKVNGQDMLDTTGERRVNS